MSKAKMTIFLFPFLPPQIHGIIICDVFHLAPAAPITEVLSMTENKKGNRFSE
jgi:hypothetical protein